MSGEGALRSLPGPRLSLFERMAAAQRLDDDEVESRAGSAHNDDRS